MRLQMRKLLLRFEKYLLPLADGERLVRFVFEAQNSLAVIFIAHPTFKRAIAAGGRIEQAPPQFIGVYRAVGNRQHISHPLRVETTTRCHRRVPGNPSSP